MLPSKLKQLIDKYCMGIQPTDTQIDEIMDLAISLSADSNEVAQYMEEMQQGPTKEERKAIAKAEDERKAKEAVEKKAEAERKAKEEAERKAKEAAEKKAKREAAKKARDEQENQEREDAARRVQEQLQQKKKKQQKIRRRLLIEFILTWVLCIVVFITSDLSFFESTLFSILLYLCILFIEFLSWAQRRLGN
jgi:cation transport ATPase